MSACNLSCYRPTHRTSVVVLVSWSCSGGSSRPLLGSIGLGLGNGGLVLGLGLQNTVPGLSNGGLGLGLENTGPGLGNGGLGLCLETTGLVLGNGSLGLRIIVVSCLYVMANHSSIQYTLQLVWIPRCLTVL